MVNKKAIHNATQKAIQNGETMQSIREYLRRGPSTSREIQVALGLSQSSTARLLRKMGNEIIPIKDGRTVKYAATANAFGSSDKIPLCTIDDAGAPNLIGYIRPLNCGQFFIDLQEDAAYSPLLLGESGNGLYEDLPYFLLDLKPQGFLGRQIARTLSLQSPDFPTNPKNWNTNHIGRYLISNGEDLPGNFLFGEQLMLRLRREPTTVSRQDYPELADRAMKGEPPGSSAGGEQPKFTAFNGEASAHVIVKFTAKSRNEMTERWRDILVTEFHAAKILAETGYPAAKTDLFEQGGRMFLEIQRFDRRDKFGRLSMISLDIIDREFVGYGGSSWSGVMADLLDQGLVDTADIQRTKELEYFGNLIHNTDMHLGNLSLAMQGEQFKLLPAYDMCTMGFAPHGGDVLPLDFVPRPNGLDLGKEEANRIEEMAFRFWENVSADHRISQELKIYLSQGNPVSRVSSS